MAGGADTGLNGFEHVVERDGVAAVGTSFDGIAIEGFLKFQFLVCCQGTESF